MEPVPTDDLSGVQASDHRVLAGRRVGGTAEGGRGRAREGEGGQESGKGLTNAAGSQSLDWEGAFPGQSAVADCGPGEAELSVGGHHAPRPAVGLLGVADPRCCPVEHLLPDFPKRSVCSRSKRRT